MEGTKESRKEGRREKEDLVTDILHSMMKARDPCLSVCLVGWLLCMM